MSNNKPLSKKMKRLLTNSELTNQGKVMSSENIFINVYDMEEMLQNQILQRRVQNLLPTSCDKINLIGDSKKMNTWVRENFSNCKIFQLTESGGIILDNEDNFIQYSSHYMTLTVTLYGSVDFCSKTTQFFKNEFREMLSSIEWVYNPDGSACTVPLNCEKLPVSEMYPFLNGEDVESYYDRYMESSANILLLIGPPGTGKTTFIRGLLAHTNSSAIVSYDSAILEKDGFFANFIEGSSDIMVLEDSDTFLMSRSDGNTMMHRFLNVGDGLVSAKGKKIIFSTNLPSVRDVDSALVRPGRCFDILSFDKLTGEQAKKLADKLGVDIDNDQHDHSIAELFNKQEKKPKERKFGFM